MSSNEKAIVIALFRHTLPPFNDCLDSLQATIRTGSDHLCTAACNTIASPGCPKIEDDQPSWKRFEVYSRESFHIDIVEVQTAESSLQLYIGIDRTAKFDGIFKQSTIETVIFDIDPIQRRTTFNIQHSRHRAANDVPILADARWTPD